MPIRDELPLLTLYLTDRCNSRCVTCDHWRTGRDDLTLGAARAMLPSLQALGTRIVQLSGGEPLVHREWQAIARVFRDAGLRVWLLTAGLALAKQAAAVCAVVDELIVSLDGADREAYLTIRGVDAFEVVCAGIRTAADLGRPATLRVTVQRGNYRQLPAFVRLARELGARRISFLAVDIANSQAFGRDRDGTVLGGAALVGAALDGADLTAFDALLRHLEAHHAADFANGFIAESPAKLQRMWQYFAAVRGAADGRPAPFPTTQCRAPEFSAVVDARGRLHPCFFIAGTDAPEPDLRLALRTPQMQELRSRIRAGARAECVRCVCTLSRAPDL